MKYSFVVSVKNRPVQRCIDSLKWQQTDTNYEIILVDYGSNNPLPPRPKVRTVRFARNRNWNHPRANNIGIAKATGMYVICVNSDIIVFPQMLNVLDMLFEVNKQYQIYWQRFDLNQYGTNLIGRSITRQNWDVIERYIHAAPRDLGEHHPLTAYGDFMAVNREALLVSGGYDERMPAWGYYDIDLAQRLERMGYPIYWGLGAKLLHQYHEPPSKERARRNIMIGKYDHRISRNSLEMFDVYRELEEQ